MTDLERARDYARSELDIPLWIAEAIDAHLKEDAERAVETQGVHESARKVHQAWQAQKTELARLREEYEKAKAVLQEWIDRAAELSGQRDTLLAALRFCQAADIARRGGDQSYEDDRIERTASAAIAEVKP